MAEGLTAVLIVWRYPGKEVYVTGEVNEYAMTELNGEQEKAAVLWLSPGKYLYRYVVDGSYAFDPLKDCVREGKTWYNLITVDPPPPALTCLSTFSLEQMEELDRGLTSYTSSFSSTDDPTPSIIIPRTSVPKALGCMSPRKQREIRAAETISAWWLRRKVWL